MGRSGSVVSAIVVLVMVAALAGCSSSPTRTTVFPVPAKIRLSPADIVSIDVGATATFTGIPENAASVTISEPVSYRSSNTAVVTIADNGMACAGTWNSLSNPQICTPGPVGTAQITATTLGVSSPPTTVYVHQHIDSIVISPILSTPPPPQPPCVSKGLTANYQAIAYNRGGGPPPGVDITATVGTFAWQTFSTNVVTLNVATPTHQITGLLPGQMQATAGTPGMTSIFASATGVNSLPMDFTTCAVQSIALAVSASTSTTRSITATVVDTQGTTITGVPLTWTSSEPGAVSVSGSSTSTTFGGTATATASTATGGGAAIVASCTPPTCNIGFLPTLPIYPPSVVTFAVSQSGTVPSGTVLVSSTGCGRTEGCTSTIVPITIPANTVGNAANLPATPNSLVFDRQGSKAYLGTDFGDLGTKGLMVVNAAASPPAVTQVTSVVGKVLAVSPDGRKVIVAEKKFTPTDSNTDQVFVFDSTSNTSVVLPIVGATAADFSPDSLKAFIVADSTLYVYSTLDALQAVPLSPLGPPATDVAFLANGMFGYMAGGDPMGVSFLPTCDVPKLPTPGVALPGTALLEALPDGTTMLTLSPPTVQTFTANISGTLVVGQDGCPMPRGGLMVTNTLDPRGPVDLGLGNFVPTQLIVSSDGSKAYVTGSNLGTVAVFDIGNRTASSIALTGSVVPTRASLTLGGSFLYVAASDGTVHVLDTQADVDLQQIPFPATSSNPQGGLCTGVTFTCGPDLIAVRP